MDWQKIRKEYKKLKCPKEYKKLKCPKAVYCDTDSIYYLQSAPKEITQNIDKWNAYIDNYCRNF